MNILLPMKTIKALVVDDEPASQENLCGLLQRYCPQVDIVDAVGDAASAEAAIRGRHPDLVFLDIEMPGANGFDLLDRMADVPDVVFVTAHEQYALNAIKRYALDYILKPIDVEDLLRAVARKQEQDAPQLERRRMMRAEGMHGGLGKRLALPSAQGLYLIGIGDIVRCEAEGHYTTFHMKDGKQHLVTQGLGQYEDLLVPHGFFRIHHAHLVNLACVRQYIRGRGGYVLLDDGRHLDVSARRRDAFLAALGQ